MRILSKGDYRTAHSIIEGFKEHGITPANNEHLRDILRDMRAYTHRPASASVLVKNYGIDGYIERFDIPAEVTDPEAYFEEFHRLEYIPSPYDCTGQGFTSWHRIFEKPAGGWRCYHRVGVDV